MKLEIPKALRLREEGLWGALRFAWNLFRDAEGRRRFAAMRRVFMKYRPHLATIMLVGIKRHRRTQTDDYLIEERDGNGGAPFGPAKKLEMSWRRAIFS